MFELHLHFMSGLVIYKYNKDWIKHEGIITGKYSPIISIWAGVVGWCEGAVYLTSLGRPTDIGLQLGKACYPCSG